MTRTYENMDGYKNEGLVEILAGLSYCLFSWLVEIFVGQQSLENPNWFQGTAVDAIRWCLWLLEEHNVLECLILVEDQLPLMDCWKFIQTHRDTDADIMATVLSMDEKDATAFSIMIIDDEGRIIELAKHLKGEQVKSMELDTPLLGIEKERDKEMFVIARKEKYVVSKYLMLKWLRDKFPGANEIDSEVILDELCQLLLLLILEVFDCSSDGFTDGELATLHSKGRLYDIPDRYENDWEVVKRGWNPQVLSEIPHKFENVVREVETPREVPISNDRYLSSLVIVNENRKVVEAVKTILDAVEQGDVENADHGNAKDKIQWSLGRIWVRVLHIIFTHLEDKVKLWAAGIDKPQLYWFIA
ncbi:unnamed protein product [Lactuca virosa]|uniref:glucose-1-phosphate adenylyltransferase n=1 Tax=Lactuca virosa TaxID=75947 RepID=A0AAU9PBS7_9ASTR|nr:unnamed protein product [Lactuca virosa]